jgi:hypothetical protein
VFDIPAGTYLSAMLHLMNPPNAANSEVGDVGPNPTKTFLLHDVMTPLSELMAGQLGRVDIFNELANGRLYGTWVASATDKVTFVDISLRSDALAAINRAAGGSWAAGGADQ